jgi:RHS repeat-associated protein
MGGFLIINKETKQQVITTKENYLLKDNLGSVVGTIDIALLRASPSTYLADKTSFDAWGLRRNANWSDYSNLSSLYDFKSPVSDRGFTGHEQIDEVGLIHMNGRLYDPVIGRFISADPIIQDPTDLQSLNRYTYVRNNPLTLIDPSGFSWISKQWKKWGKDAFFNVMTAGGYSITKSALREFGRAVRRSQNFAMFVQIAGCAATGPGCAAIVGVVTYAATDGDFRAAAKAGAIAFAQAWVSQNYLHDLSIQNKGAGIFGHGVLGGAVSVAQGGKFGSGFTAGAIGKAVTLGMQGSGPMYEMDSKGFVNTDWDAVAGRTFVAAISGGLASELSGGSFANGAVTAAMQHLFNAELSETLQGLAQKYLRGQANSQVNSVIAVATDVGSKISVEGGSEGCFFTCIGFSSEQNMIGDLSTELTVGGAGMGLEPAGAINASLFSFGDNMPGGTTYGVTELGGAFFLGVAVNHKYWSQSGSPRSSFEFKLKLSSGVSGGAKTGIGHKW